MATTNETSSPTVERGNLHASLPGAPRNERPAIPACYDLTHDPACAVVRRDFIRRWPRRSGRRADNGLDRGASPTGSSPVLPGYEEVASTVHRGFGVESRGPRENPRTLPVPRGRREASGFDGACEGRLEALPDERGCSSAPYSEPRVGCLTRGDRAWPLPAPCTRPSHGDVDTGIPPPGGEEVPMTVDRDTGERASAEHPRSTPDAPTRTE
jgi:hypothetical protein